MFEEPSEPVTNGPTQSSHETGTLGQIQTNYFHIVSFFIYGSTTLLSWSAFGVNLPYFREVLNESSPELNEYTTSSISVSSMIPIMMGSLWNIVHLYRFRSGIKVIIALVVTLLGFVTLVIAVTFKVKGAYLFVIIIILCMLMNLCTPILMNSLYSDVSFYSFKCFIAFSAGLSFAGVMVAAIQLILISISIPKETKAIIFFFIAQFFLVLTITLYSIQTQSLNYSKRAFDLFKQSRSQERSLKNKTAEILGVLKKLWIAAISIFLSMAITLFLFPKLLLSVSTTSDSNSKWAIYFQTFHVFFVYNFFEFSGRYLITCLKWPRPNSRWFIVLSLSRLLLIPLYFFCNRPEATGNIVIFRHDIFPIIFTAIFGLTHAHIATIGFGAPYSLKTKQEQVDGSTLMVLMMGLGLILGSAGSFLL